MYYYQQRTKKPMDEVEAALREALKQRGFGILTEIDVKKTMKAKLDIDVPPHKILGACNPASAHKVLGMEPDIGVLLPCNVTIREDNGTVVDCVLPTVQLGKTGRDDLLEIAETIEGLLKEAVREATS